MRVRPLRAELQRRMPPVRGGSLPTLEVKLGLPAVLAWPRLEHGRLQRPRLHGPRRRGRMFLVHGQRHDPLQLPTVRAGHFRGRARQELVRRVPGRKGSGELNPRPLFVPPHGRSPADFTLNNDRKTTENKSVRASPKGSTRAQTTRSSCRALRERARTPPAARRATGVPMESSQTCGARPLVVAC